MKEQPFFSKELMFVSLSMLIVLVSVLVTMLTFGGVAKEAFVAVFASAIAVMTGLGSLLFALRTVRSHPRSLSIALIGPSGAGKTVYLTMLFKELESGAARGLIFAPYGRATTEEVSRNLMLMANGRFPPRTPQEKHTFYQAVAIYRRRFLPRRYRIQIADYAGEHLDTLDPEADVWLHQTDFFEYVVSADGLLIMIDCERLLLGRTEEISILENRVIAALHTLIEKRSDDPTTKLRIPVGLVFSKADILSEEPNSYDHQISSISGALERLISVCESRCAFFRVFVVSSLGSTPEDPEIPPKRLRPKNVLTPLLWLLGQ